MNSTARSRTPLRELIADRGLKVWWVADRAGISNYRIQRLFQGATMSLREALALSEVLGVPLDAFDAAAEQAE